MQFFFPPTGSPEHTGNKGTVILCPVYVSVTSQCCASMKTHVMLHFVVWHRGTVITLPLWHYIWLILELHMLKDKHY